MIRTPHTDSVLYLPHTFQGALAHLMKSEKIHQQAFEHSLACSKGAMFIPDFVVPGILQRSLELLEGFVMLAKVGNFTAAAPLLRLQLDNTFRFYAFHLAEDPSEVLKAMLSDLPLHRLKSKDGDRMTDSYLRQEVAKHFDWVSDVYESTSGFVHFSTPGILSSVEEVSSDDGRKVLFSVGFGAGKAWTESEKHAVADAFVHATDMLLLMVIKWGQSKEEPEAALKDDLT